MDKLPILTDEFDIEKVMEQIERPHYVVRQNDTVLPRRFASEDEARLYIRLTKAKYRIQGLPYFKNYYYCKTIDEFKAYAEYIGCKNPCSPFVTDLQPDLHFIAHAADYWQGRDWYKLRIDKDERTTYYNVETFRGYRAFVLGKLRAFDEALAHPQNMDGEYLEEEEYHPAKP